MRGYKEKGEKKSPSPLEMEFPCPVKRTYPTRCQVFNTATYNKINIGEATDKSHELKKGYNVQKMEGSTPNHILLTVKLVSCTILRT